jgi:hypothetical protein
MRRAAFSIRSVLVLFVGILPVGCEAAEERDQPFIKRVDSAGVEVFCVERPPDDTARFDAPALRIGSVDADGPEHETFALITDLVPLHGGRVAVVDNRAARVAVFDSLGSWLYDIGNRGEGPGEHTGPIYASFRRDTLFVWDALQARLSRYLTDGSFVGSTTLATWTTARPFRPVADGYIREIEWGQRSGPAAAQGALVRMSREGVLIDTLAGPYSVPARGLRLDPETGVATMVNPPALEISPPWLATETWILQLDPLAATVEYRNLETGSITRLLQLPYRPTNTTEDDRNAFFQGVSAEFGIPPEALAADTRFSELRPPVAGILVDGTGRIWIGQHEPSARGRGYVGSDWDVYYLERTSAVRLEFPGNFLLKALRAGMAYGISTLEYGVQVVDVFPVAAR